MQRMRSFRILVAGVLAVALAVGIGFGLRALGLGASDTDEELVGDEALSSAVRAKNVNGEIHLLLPPSAVAAGSITVSPLQPAEFQERVAGLGTVIAPQVLADAQRAYLAVAAEVKQGGLATRAARLEVERLQRLHRDDRIVSDKSLETAQVTAASEETRLQLASNQLGLQEAGLRQQWGPVLAEWLKAGSPPLERLLSGRDALLQIALPTGQQVRDASSASVQLTAGDPLPAKIISELPQTDPKFQGQGFYAVAAGDPRLLPGMVVPATIAMGPPVTGLMVPDDSVVRWQGRAWVFVAISDGEFVRRPLESAVASPQGWVIRSGFPAGTPIVTRGAQLLLSEEIKARPAGGQS
jgi:membrane fusion protein, multidrug efflux system